MTMAQFGINRIRGVRWHISWWGTGEKGRSMGFGLKFTGKRGAGEITVSAHDVMGIPNFFVKACFDIVTSLTQSERCGGVVG